MTRLLKVLAVTMGLVFAFAVVVAAGGTFFFGSSKVRPLFGMSAEALEGPRDAGTRDGG
jgi:hypothetical protein